MVGLGNPGAGYAKTRHNVGFKVVDDLAEHCAIEVGRFKFNTRYGRGRIETIEVILAKPMAYMNRSGPPTRQLADYFKVSPEAMIVIHDDIDLALGRLKIKKKGGHGGHNGVKSMIAAFGGGDFVRLRIGVGRSETEVDVTDHVLGEFSAQESKLISQIIPRAREAVVTILSKGTKIGMNLYNQKM